MKAPACPCVSCCRRPLFRERLPSFESAAPLGLKPRVDFRVSKIPESCPPQRLSPSLLPSLVSVTLKEGNSPPSIFHWRSRVPSRPALPRPLTPSVCLPPFGLGPFLGPCPHHGTCPWFFRCMYYGLGYLCQAQHDLSKCTKR